MNLVYPACLLLSISVFVPLAVFWEKRRNRKASVTVLPVAKQEPSNVTTLGWRDNVRQLPLPRNGKGWAS